MRTRQSTHESQLIVNKYFNLSSRLYEVNFKVIFLGNLKVRFPKKLTFFHTLLHPVVIFSPYFEGTFKGNYIIIIDIGNLNEQKDAR